MTEPRGEYFGCRMFTLSETQVRNATASCGLGETERKLSFEAEPKLAFEVTQGSYKYGPEFQVVCWQRKAPIQKDRKFNNGFGRIEIPMGIEQGFVFALNTAKSASEYLMDNPVPRHELSVTDTVYSLRLTIHALERLESCLLNQDRPVPGPKKIIKNLADLL